MNCVRCRRSHSNASKDNFATDNLKFTRNQRSLTLSTIWYQSHSFKPDKLNDEILDKTSSRCRSKMTEHGYFKGVFRRDPECIMSDEYYSESDQLLIKYIKECEVEELEDLHKNVTLKKFPFFHFVLQDKDSHRRELKVEFLIENKADLEQKVDILNGKELTPLLVAVSLSTIRCMLLLVSAGANVNAVGEFPVSSRRKKTVWKKKTALDLSAGHEILVNYFKNLNKGLTYRELKRDKFE